MATQVCRRCNNEKGEEEFDRDGEGILRKGCRNCLVSLFKNLQTVSTRNYGCFLGLYYDN